MKNLRKLFALIAIVSFAATSCSTTDEEIIEPGQTTYEKIGSWDCTTGESCQDVYEMNFKVGTQISLNVTDITENSVVKIAIYGPNSLLGGTNIITGNSKEISCWGQEESATIPNITILDGGIHKIAITRDWGSSAGADGDYKLSIIASEKFTDISQTVEDIESEASGDECPA